MTWFGRKRRDDELKHSIEVVAAELDVSAAHLVESLDRRYGAERVEGILACGAVTVLDAPR